MYAIYKQTRTLCVLQYRKSCTTFRVNTQQSLRAIFSIIDVTITWSYKTCTLVENESLKFGILIAKGITGEGYFSIFDIGAIFLALMNAFFSQFQQNLKEKSLLKLTEI